MAQYGQTREAAQQAKGSTNLFKELVRAVGAEEATRRVAEAVKNQGLSKADAGLTFKTGSTARMAGSPNMLARTNALLGRSKIPLAGLSILGSLSAGAKEMNDDDGFGRNLSQAGARTAADLATTAGLAALGTAILPGIGTVGVPLLASVMGIQDTVGEGAAGLATGLYNAVTGTTAEDEQRRKQRERNEADAASQLGIDLDRLEGVGAQTLALAAKQAELNNSINKYNLGLQNEYNYANMLNQAALNQQQINANQSAQLAAYLMN